MNLRTDKAIRELFSDEAKKKILKIEKWGPDNAVAFFKTVEERETVFASLSRDPNDENRRRRSQPATCQDPPAQKTQGFR